MKHAELTFIMTAFFLLFFMQAEETGSSLCFFNQLGISWCPGCGLGHSIYHALHGHFEASFQHHMLGIPAVLIMLNRVRQLIFNRKQQFI